MLERNAARAEAARDNAPARSRDRRGVEKRDRLEGRRVWASLSIARGLWQAG